MLASRTKKRKQTVVLEGKRLPDVGHVEISIRTQSLAGQLDHRVAAVKAGHERALRAQITDRAPAFAIVVEEVFPASWHNTGQYENNRVECDHGRLKARLWPMRGVKANRTASMLI